jgi:hypothetical protein
MSALCIGEPVSWLRLEQYVLGELPDDDRPYVQRHIESCPVCGEALEFLRKRDGAAPLPALALVAGPAAAAGRTDAELDRELERDGQHRGIRPNGNESRSQRFRRSWRSRRSWGLWRSPRSWGSWRFWAAWGAGLSVSAAAASLLFSVTTRDQPQALSAADNTAKGGDYALELVREHGAGAADAGVFEEGDRFRVLATCPAGREMAWDVAVYQDGKVFFPLPGGRLTCANRQALPGAFTLSGRTPVLACIVLADSTLPRASLLKEGRPALPPSSACALAVPGSK